MDFEKFFPCLFPFFFILLWAILLFVSAKIGAWSHLAEYYQTQSKFEGKKWHFRAGNMYYRNYYIGTSYSGYLTIGLNDYGLYLAVFPLFRAGHPPLLIPWKDITTSKGKRFLTTTFDFTFTRVPSVTLSVSEELGDTLLSFRTDFR